MSELLEFLKGKKSYLLAAVMIVLGILQGFEIFIVPESVWLILGGSYGLSLRAGIKKIAEAIDNDS